MKIFQLLIFLCLWLQASVNGQAQILIDPYRFSSAAASTLLLDETGLGSAALAVSMRHLRAAYSGYFVRIRRSSDSAEADFGDDGTGWITSSSIAANGSNPLLDGQDLATFFSGVDGFVVTWFDQSGNARNATQATAANQPKIVSGGTLVVGSNSKPAIDFISSDSLVTGSNLGILGDVTTTVFCVLAQDTTTADSSPYGWGTTGAALNAIGPIAGLTTNGKYSVAFAGANNFNDSASHGTGWQISTLTKTAGAINTTTTIYKNGSAGSDAGGSSTSTPNVVNSALRIGVWANSGSFYLDGKMSELVIYGSVLSGGTLTTGHNNINTAYTLY